jgi:LacI family transcriptional regulator
MRPHPRHMADRDKRTIYDVASEAGVAISTVSRVLNGSAEVSDATRLRVQAAIEKLQFRPQRTARILAQQQTHSLAVAMPSFTSLFYVEVLKGVKDELREHDIDLLLCNLGSVSPYQTLYRFLNRGAVDALLLSSLPLDDKLERELKRLHAPVVLVGVENRHFDCIFWDDEDGAAAATRHLTGLGHRRVGMITSHASSSTSDGRIRGYRRALEEAALPFDPQLVVAGDTSKHAGFSEEAGFEAMHKLVRLSDRPTAVFATSDVKAFGAWSAARDLGLSVPGDVALVGYDNLKLTRFLGLTTMDQQMYAVGRRAALRLYERMNSWTEERISEKIKPELIVRRSSAGRD